MATRKRSVNRLSDAVLVDLLESARASLAGANGSAEVQYEAAVEVLAREAVKRGLVPREPKKTASPVPAVVRPEDSIPRADLVLGAGSEAAVFELLSELEPQGMHDAWRAALRIPEPDLRLSRLTALCLALDRRVFGEDTAEQRHRSYALFPGGIDARLQLVNSAIAGTFALLRMRAWS